MTSRAIDDQIYLSIHYPSNYSYEIVKVTVMKEGAQYLSFLGPFLSFREGHVLSNESGPVLEEGLFFDEVFLEMKKLLNENGID